jgi:UDP-2,3-diacylglucosamine pyrophosphatase LpxH
MATDYVCLSDLHFGGVRSLLTNLTSDQCGSMGVSAVDTTKASPVLEGLVNALRERLANEAPRLILLGDVLELALAQEDVAIEAFARFLQLAFPRGDLPLFQGEIWYVPGNHDHHVWETARENDYVSTFAPGASLVPSSHITSMLPASRPVSSPLLDAIARWAVPHAVVTFRVFYPNLAIGTAGGPTIVLHHGHFVEPLYTALSRLRPVVIPGDTGPQDTSDYEEDNWAWLDFVWSGLGRSGAAGEDLLLAYGLLQDPEGTRALALGVLQRLPLPRRWAVLRDGPLRWPIRSLVSGAAPPERFRPAQPLSPSAVAGLEAYLNVAIKRQLVTELYAESAGPIPLAAFIFGHTHKPFEADCHFHGFPQDARVVNTGGWVVDAMKASTLHGGAAVAISHDLAVTRLLGFRYDSHGEPVCETSPDLQAALERAVPIRRALAEDTTRRGITLAGQAHSPSVLGWLREVAGSRRS